MEALEKFFSRLEAAGDTTFTGAQIAKMWREAKNEPVALEPGFPRTLYRKSDASNSLSMCERMKGITSKEVLIPVTVMTRAEAERLVEEGLIDSTGEITAKAKVKVNKLQASR